MILILIFSHVVFPEYTVQKFHIPIFECSKNLFRRRNWQSTPVFLPGESRGQRSLVGCCPWGCTDSGTTEVTQHACMHWRMKWHPTPVFLPGESQGRGSLVGCRLLGRTESDTTDATQQQQQKQESIYFYFVSISHISCVYFEILCVSQGFPGGSDCKESACNAGDSGSIPGSGIFPRRREWLPPPVFLPKEFYGQRSLVGYCPWGLKESDTTECVSCRNLLQC